MGRPKPFWVPHHKSHDVIVRCERLSHAVCFYEVVHFSAGLLPQLAMANVSGGVDGEEAAVVNCPTEHVDRFATVLEDARVGLGTCLFRRTPSCWLRAQ
jgi:hypothetical protein